MTAVLLKKVMKKFGDFTAVDHISLEVSSGEIFGFLGPNGAGKSTTIRMLCGLLKPSSGEGWVHGLDIVTQAEEIKSNLGYMSQRFSLYEDLKVEENMRFFGGIYGLNGKALEKRMEQILQLIGLTDRNHALTKSLPGGLKQRLALGCAILHRPPVLFLDEPTSGVDPVTRRNFWALIYALAEERVTVFVTTHYMEEAEYCQRIALINRGKLIALGSPADLKREHLRGQIYEIEVDDALAGEEAVRDAEDILDVAVFGRVLHVRVTREVEGTRLLHSLLSKAGLAVRHLRTIEPTLEDVFVALVAGKEGQNP